MTKHAILVILMILIASIIYYFFQSGMVTFFDPCEESRDIYNLRFKGVVVKKNYPTPLFKGQYLIIDNNVGNKQIEVNLLHDENLSKGSTSSQLCETVNIGDSVVKEKGSFDVRYKKAGSDWQRVKLGYDLCP
ncbi:MAG: hypothetical protein HC819_23020 [Cyclobacteriaceae bacterium]|nr:hypothetical protein [Cyclobacteriaceae bacterium]